MENICKNWTQWLMETRFAFLTPELKKQTMNWLEMVRDKVLSRADLQKGETVLDIGTGTGLLAFKALEIMEGTGTVIFSDKFQDCLDSCEEFLKSTGINTGYKMMLAPAEHISMLDNSVDKALMRSVLVHIVDKQPALNEIYRILKPGGRFCCFEPIIASNTRYWELTTPEKIENFEAFKRAENEFMSNPNDPLCNFNQDTLAKNLENAGFSDGDIDLESIPSTYYANRDMVEKWFISPPAPDQLSMKQRFMKYFDEKIVDNYIEDVKNDLDNKQISVCATAAYINVIK